MKILFLGLLMIGSVSAFSASKLTLDVTLNPAGSFQAASEDVKGDLVKKGNDFSAKKIQVAIQSLKTGIDLRDEHFWKHLNSTKYGTATLTNLKGKDGKATALLEVSGVKRPVNINYKEDGDHILASFDVNAKDFKLPDAEYMGIGVEDKVHAEVSMNYKKK